MAKRKNLKPGTRVIYKSAEKMQYGALKFCGMIGTVKYREVKDYSGYLQLAVLIDGQTEEDWCSYSDVKLLKAEEAE